MICTKMQTSYFPYGLPMHGLSSNPQYNRLMYNGNELQTDHALNVYDFNARQQDPQTGRFWAIDPFAESYASISPYTYCAGDPINSADPTGCYIQPIIYDNDLDQRGTGGGGGGLSNYRIANFNAGPDYGKIIEAIDRGEDISQYAKELGSSLVFTSNSSGVYVNQEAAEASNVTIDMGRCTINSDGSVADVSGAKGNGNAYNFFFGDAMTPLTFAIGDQQNGNVSNGILDSPVGNAKIGDAFGIHRNVGSSPHLGTDYKVPIGTLVHTTASGKVVRSQFSSSYGNVVIISHGNNVYTLYGHGSKLLVSNGESVKTNQTIMLSGNTGHSTGPHLHYEVIVAPHGLSSKNFYNDVNIRRCPSKLKNLLNP